MTPADLMSDGGALRTFSWDDRNRQNPDWVCLVVTGVTARRTLHTMTRDGDSWHTILEMPSCWRGSYGFIPGWGDPEPGAPDDLPWWRDHYAGVVPDPTNPGPTHATMLGGVYSEMAMPAAPPPHWMGPSQRILPQPDDVMMRQMQIADVDRNVWIHPCGVGSKPRDLVIVFDGAFWATQMPVFGAFQRLNQESDLGPLLVVLVDSVDFPTRDRDLGCSPRFRDAIVKRLLPALETEFAITRDPLKRIVAGQSLGGLAAVDLVLEHPDAFGSAVSSSGSFWWPDHQEASWNWGHRLERVAGGIRLWLEAGELEPDMAEVTTRLAGDARRHGVPVHRQVFCGGHEVVQWAEGVLTGTAYLLDERNGK